MGAITAHIKRAQNPVVPHNMQGLWIANSSPAASKMVKLAAISPPQFHGSLGEWVHFRDSFQSLINRNESLSNIERFHYPKSAVKGEAAWTLTTLPVSDSNYSATWEDTNELIDYHVDALFSLRAIRKESADEVRELMDDFNNHIRSLQSLEEPVNKWDPILIRIFVEKLDARTREEWEKRVSKLGRRKTLQNFLAKTGRPSQASPSTSNRFKTPRQHRPSSAC